VHLSEFIDILEKLRENVSKVEPNDAKRNTEAQLKVIKLN